MTPGVAVTTGAAAVFATSCCVRSRPATASRCTCFGPKELIPPCNSTVPVTAIDRRRDRLAAVHSGDRQLGARVRRQRGALESEQPAEERRERSERRVRHRHARSRELEERCRRRRRLRLAASAAGDGDLLLVAAAEAAEEHRDARFGNGDVGAVRAGPGTDADELLLQVRQVVAHTDRAAGAPPRFVAVDRDRVAAATVVDLRDDAREPLVADEGFDLGAAAAPG